MSTPIAPATVLDITDRLPEPAAEAAIERPYAPAPDTYRLSERYAMLATALVTLIGAVVFGASFWALGLPQGGVDGIGATVGIGFLIVVCLGVAAMTIGCLREDFARFCAHR